MNPSGRRGAPAAAGEGDGAPRGAADPPEAPIRVGVAFAAPGREAIVELDLPAGATVADAVAASGVLPQPGYDTSAMQFAVYGRRVTAATVLIDGDRVELTRPLQIDVKRARQTRAQRAGASDRDQVADDDTSIA
jgi:uncharacterized protein